ncbi:hypothetical protein B0H19DRAFT_945263 [Mycena capillaripes]|nr:hypothetical protein B0H19DRAFT_945263 [Mycena capillaripes]
MFECLGVLLSLGWQRKPNKIIRKSRHRAQRRSTFVSLHRVRCAVEEVFKYATPDEMIWRLIRSVTLQRLTREFFWKCMQSTFRVGDFWLNIDSIEMCGLCRICGAPEPLEHTALVALDCEAPGQKLIWDPIRQLWSKKYEQWPDLSQGLNLDCNLVKFKSDKGMVVPERGRLFAILADMEPPLDPCIPESEHYTFRN